MTDLRAETPYENRRKTGLQPTPNASPGVATLKGELEPVAENTSDAGRQENRRVEIVIE